MAAYLEKLYKEQVIDQLKKEFNYSNPMEVPKITKVSINMGVGEAAQDSKVIKSAYEDLTLIAGQKPVITRAKKSIAGFKLREQQPIGVRVTLRKQHMYEFLERLVHVAMPRIRDFRGLSKKSFDGNGNFTFGLKEQIVFPEVDYDKTDKIRGLDITIVTTAKNNKEAKKLLELLNMPFYN